MRSLHWTIDYMYHRLATPPAQNQYEIIDLLRYVHIECEYGREVCRLPSKWNALQYLGANTQSNCWLLTTFVHITENFPMNHFVEFNHCRIGNATMPTLPTLQRYIFIITYTRPREPHTTHKTYIQSLQAFMASLIHLPHRVNYLTLFLLLCII